MDKAQLPKYQQVMETIKGKISKGEWPIGSKIPSQRKLAEEFGVNRSTIINALEELAADGLIEGKTGVGTGNREKKADYKKSSGSTSIDQRAPVARSRDSASTHAFRYSCSRRRDADWTSNWARSRPARRVSAAGTGS